MRIEKELNYYVIAKGQKAPDYFVRINPITGNAQWTRLRPWTAKRFHTEIDALLMLRELQALAYRGKDGW